MFAQFQIKGRSQEPGGAGKREGLGFCHLFGYDRDTGAADRQAIEINCLEFDDSHLLLISAH